MSISITAYAINQGYNLPSITDWSPIINACIQDHPEEIITFPPGKFRCASTGIWNAALSSCAVLTAYISMEVIPTMALLSPFQSLIAMAMLSGITLFLVVAGLVRMSMQELVAMHIELRVETANHSSLAATQKAMHRLILDVYLCGLVDKGR
jgi:hypothetical protein